MRDTIWKGSEVLWEREENSKEISDGNTEIWKYGNTDGECILRIMKRSYITTTSSLIAAVEPGLFNNHQKLANGYLVFIASIPSAPISLPLRFKEVRLVNVGEAARARTPSAPI